MDPATVYLLMVFLVQMITGQVNYTVHKTESDWTVASKACSLATPRLIYTRDGNYTVEFDNSDIQLEKGDNYWIGYQRGYKTFKYEGCGLRSSNLTYNYLLKPIPGLCFTACSIMMKSTYYGLRLVGGQPDMAECYCLKEKPKKLLETQCGRGCIYDPENYAFVLCGGTNHISVYSTIGHTSLSRWIKDYPNPKFIGHCVTYENIDKGSHEWFWTGCTRSFHPLCDQTLQEGEMRQLVEFDNENRNWIQSASYCINQNNLYPTSIVYDRRNKYQRDSLEITSPAWTALFRDQVVFISKKESPVPGETCAFVTAGENGQVTMSFRSCLEASSFKYICQEGQEATTTLMTNATDTSVTLSEYMSSTEASSEAFRKSQDDKKISLIVPIVVGVVCGILIIGAIIAVIVCIRKRNKRLQQEAETKSIPELEHYTQHITGMDYAVVDKFRDEEGGGTQLYANESANIPHEDPVVPFSIEPVSNGDTDYYDHTDSKKMEHKSSNSDNVYNKLNLKEGEGTYNISGADKKQAVHPDDGLYNKLESERQSGMYDRTGGSKDGKASVVDPSYDRTNKDDKDNNSVTDNKRPNELYSRVIKR